MDTLQTRGELKYVSQISGIQFVAALGIPVMQELFVCNWGSCEKVRLDHKCLGA